MHEMNEIGTYFQPISQPLDIKGKDHLQWWFFSINILYPQKQWVEEVQLKICQICHI